MEKRRNCSGAISPLFHNILLPLVRFSCLNRDQILLRDMRLFEIDEIEITRVDYMYKSRIVRKRSLEMCASEESVSSF